MRAYTSRVETTLDSPHHAGEVPIQPLSSWGGPEAVTMDTRVAWSPSPTRPRISAALEPSDWVASWTLPPALSLLRGGGGVLSSWDSFPEDLCFWPLWRDGFSASQGEKH